MPECLLPLPKGTNHSLKHLDHKCDGNSFAKAFNRSTDRKYIKGLGSRPLFSIYLFLNILSLHSFHCCTRFLFSTFSLVSSPSFPSFCLQTALFSTITVPHHDQFLVRLAKPLSTPYSVQCPLLRWEPVE